MVLTPSFLSACRRWLPFGVQYLSSCRMAMIGSRNSPIFSTTPINRLTCASEGSRWYGVGSTRRDRQRDDQQRLAAERIAVAPEHGAAVRPRPAPEPVEFALSAASAPPPRVSPIEPAATFLRRTAFFFAIAADLTAGLTTTDALSSAERLDLARVSASQESAPGPDQPRPDQGSQRLPILHSAPDRGPPTIARMRTSLTTVLMMLGLGAAPVLAQDTPPAVVIYPILVQAPVYGATVNVPSFPGGGDGSEGGRATTDWGFNSAYMGGMELHGKGVFGEVDVLWTKPSASHDVTPRIDVTSDIWAVTLKGGYRVYKGLGITGGARYIAVNLDADSRVSAVGRHAARIVDAVALAAVCRR